MRYIIFDSEYVKLLKWNIFLQKEKETYRKLNILQVPDFSSIEE